MSRAIFVTGFNNWGKSTIIRRIFRRENFSSTGDQVYTISDIKTRFTVQQKSNDDMSHNKFLREIEAKIRNSSSNDGDLICAFCPTLEPNNDAIKIMRNEIFSSYDELRMVLLKYKWDYHAELCVEQIKRHFLDIEKVKFFVIDEINCKDREQARVTQLISHLRELYS